MSNINALNTLLRNADTADKLVDEYRRVCPDVLSENLSGVKNVSSERASINVCTGAAEFVVTVLSGNKSLYDQMERNDGLRKPLNKGTAQALFPKVNGNGGLRIGLLDQAEGELSHQCVFAGSGNQWAFYQANTNGGEGARFTLAPKLNPQGRNWCINDMSANAFADFFVGLTDPGYGIRLFNPSMTSWHLKCFNTSGQNLLA